MHAPAYAETHCKTNFTFLEGASHAAELVERAKQLGYAALAVTDRHSLAGIVRAHVAAKEHGLKLLVGAELHPADAPPLVVWALDRRGYGRLCRLLTVGNRRAPKGQCFLKWRDIAEHAEGLLCGVPLARFAPGRFDWLGEIRGAFGDRAYALAELHVGPHDAAALTRMQAAAKQARLPLVAANDVHCHHAARRIVQDVLTAVRLGMTVAEAAAAGALFPNGERRLRERAVLAARFAACPEALPNSVEIAARCSFCLDELRYEYPRELCPAGRTQGDYLAELTWLGAASRYPDGVPDAVRQQVERELAIIAELRYEAYFLTVWDIVRFARSREILCQGRGSAANSAVCYCLGVTAVDPTCTKLLFERFISPERNEPPDIDIDFEHQRREEVLQYLYERFGRERAGLAATVIRYRPRSAVRDVGKALGLSLDRVDRLAKTLGHWGDAEALPDRFREAGLDPDSATGQRLRYVVEELLDFPRHLSQHVGGMVLTEAPLCEMVPIQNAAMPDRTVIEWDKDDLDAAGLLKVDCLALGMLSAIRRCFALVKDHEGRDFALATVPQDDRDTYAMIQRADTVGVFQIESRAQMSMLPRLRPERWYDLVIEVAIVRPGPITGQMVHPYLRRRQGREPVTYPSREVEGVLERTLGVPLFQEQVMSLAVVAAGFTPGEADKLRRAMAAWKRGGHLERYRTMLLDGMAARGYAPEFAERIFEQIKGFSGYGFPESHAASFAHLVYVSCYLKRHHPAAFTAALLNSQPMGFYAPAQLVADARRHGVEVRPADVLHSAWDCTLETAVRGLAPNSLPPLRGEGWGGGQDRLALRLGLRLVSGLSEAAAERIVTARTTHSFASLPELARRAGLDRRSVELLARADAFRSLGLNRRAAVWAAAGLERRRETQLTLFGDIDDPAPLPALPLQPPLAAVLDDYGAVGLSLTAHPLSFRREELRRRGVSTSAEINAMRHGQFAVACGLVLVRQQPATAKGVRFMTLEDETGIVNLIVKRAVHFRDRHAGRSAPIIYAYGRVQQADNVLHLIPDRIEDAAAILHSVPQRARSFR